MGFFQDIAKNPLSITPRVLLPFTNFMPNAYGRDSAPQENGNDTRDTYTPIMGKNNKAQGLADSIFGTNDPQGYTNVINQGYQNLSQPLTDPAHDRTRVAVEATRGLAATFADRVLQKTGFLPSEEQVRQFVSQNLTPGFAAKFIQGLPPDQISGMADDYLMGNPDALSNPGTQGQQKSAEEQRLMGLKDQLDKIYGAGKENLVRGYDDTVYGPAKTRAANDLAGQGMLTAPNSRYTLDAIEGNRGRDIASGLNTLEGARATGQVDLGKTIEDLLQKNKDRAQGAYQFNKSFNAGREDTSFNQGLQRQSLSIADQLGKIQAGKSQKDWMDYLNTGLNAAGTYAKFAAL